MRIAVLETDEQPADLVGEFGSLSDMMARWLRPALPGAEFHPVEVAGGAPMPAPESFDGYVVTGSRAAAYDAEPWIDALSAFLRALRGAGRPMVGVCFGHQIMAQAFGGQVEKSADGYLVGRRLVQPQPGWPGGGDPLPVLAYHQDQVRRIPEGSEVLASYEGCPIGALGYGFPALSVQWHPEFDLAFMQRLLDRHSASMLGPDGVARARATLDGPPDGAAVARAAARVLRRG